MTQQAVSSERRRIARDLQALVLQRVEDAARQIEIASKQLRSDPPRATETIEGIEASGRATVVEMGRVLSLIRATNEDAADGAGAMPAGGQP